MENYNNVLKLIAKNDYFYEQKIIEKKEYVKNNILFAKKLNSILEKKQKLSIKDFFNDEYNIVKFRLSISILEVTSN